MMKRLCLFRIVIICLLVGLIPCAVIADYYAARNGANTHTYPFTSWATAASNIQDAVNAATNSAIVWVGAGTYTAPTSAVTYLGTNVVYIDKELDLLGASGNAADVIIDGESTNRGIAAVYSSGYDFTLANVTVSNCFATNRGGGIFIDSQWATHSILNCVITDNRVAPGAGLSQGAGLFAWRNNAAFQFFISDCIIRNNEALSAGSTYGEGGGVYLTSPKTGGGGYIVDSLFEYNSAAAGGGIQYRSGGTLGLNISNCIVRYNTASPNPNGGYGGGLHFYYGPARMWNCLVYKNNAYYSGGGIFHQKSDTLYLYNCTIVSNVSVNSYSYGSGIHVRPASGAQNERIEMYNCIVRSNRLVDVMLSVTSASYIAYSCLPTNQEYCISGTGPYIFDSNSLTNDPEFVDFMGMDFHLSNGSPCRNTGSNDLSWMSTTLDLDDNPRIDRTFNRVDMGCYEHQYHGSLVTIQ